MSLTEQEFRLQADHALEALQRSLMRPAAQRFDTLAVVNERGALHGIVRIEKLIQAMLQDKSTTPRVLQMTAERDSAVSPEGSASV